VNESAKQKGLEGRVITFIIKKGKQSMVITVVYMKVEGGRDHRRINARLLEELSVIGEKYKNESWMVKLVMGDFNAHVG
jgi:hypothetical protein